MPRYPHARVDIAGIMTVHMTKSPPQAIFVRWHGNDVNMVGHQAVGSDRDIRPSRGVGQKIEIKLIIAVFEKHLLAAVAPLRDVMRHAWKHDAREPSHPNTLQNNAIIKGLLHLSP